MTFMGKKKEFEVVIAMVMESSIFCDITPHRESQPTLGGSPPFSGSKKKPSKKPECSLFRSDRYFTETIVIKTGEGM
jgi:hypothetical protein